MGFLLKDGRGGALMDKWLAEWVHKKYAETLLGFVAYFISLSL
jgi:hypothetical protein